jgi:hypothetical protein
VPITLLGMLATVLFRDRVGCAMTLLAIGLLCFPRGRRRSRSGNLAGDGAAGGTFTRASGSGAGSTRRSRSPRRGALVGLERAAGEAGRGLPARVLVAALASGVGGAGLFLPPIVEPRSACATT